MESLNQQKMAKDVDFRAPAGRESLWTTDKKSNFHMATVKSRNHQFRIFRFEGFNLTPWLMAQASSTFEVCEARTSATTGSDFYKPFYAFDWFKLRDVYFSL
jgi:hypothetical protein